MTKPWTKALDSAYLRLAIFTSVAAFAAYVVAELIPYAASVPAAITAVVGVRVTFHSAIKECLFQVLGALLGGAIALGIVSLIGSNPIVILLLVLLSFAMARLMRIASPEESPFVAASLAVTVILVVGTHLTTELAVERFLGVAVGAFFALIATLLTAPTKESRALRTEMDEVQQALSALLNQIAQDLRDGLTPAIASTRFDEAVDLRNRVLGLAVQFEDLSRNRKWNPRTSATDVERLEAIMSANQTMSARVLSLAADLRGNGPSNLPPAAVNPLADLIAMAAENVAAEDPATSLGRTEAHEAVRGVDATAQIALIGGIVSHVNRINQASATETPPDD
ncbi:MAG: aromatic acid exporter family protein [Actinomycetota bacterium]